MLTTLSEGKVFRKDPKGLKKYSVSLLRTKQVSGALLELICGKRRPPVVKAVWWWEVLLFCLFCLLSWDLIRRALWGPLEDDDFSFVPFSRRAAVG